MKPQSWYIEDEESPPVRPKSRRERIKTHRAKRNRKRFYTTTDKERARH